MVLAHAHCPSELARRAYKCCARLFARKDKKIQYEVRVIVWSPGAADQ